MEENPSRICELLVGLGEVEVLGVDDEPAGPLAVHIRTRRRPTCGGCGGAVWSKGASPVSMVDLPAFGRRCASSGTSGAGVARPRAALWGRSPRSPTRSRPRDPR